MIYTQRSLRYLQYGGFDLWISMKPTTEEINASRGAHGYFRSMRLRINCLRSSTPITTLEAVHYDCKINDTSHKACRIRKQGVIVW